VGLLLRKRASVQWLVIVHLAEVELLGASASFCLMGAAGQLGGDSLVPRRSRGVRLL